MTCWRVNASVRAAEAETLAYNMDGRASRLSLGVGWARAPASSLRQKGQDEAAESVRAVDLGLECGTCVQVEQVFSDAQEGSVVWDCALVMISFLASDAGVAAGLHPAGKHVLEVGAGTGVVGLCLAVQGASSVQLTDRSSQIPLIERNIARNKALCGTDSNVTAVELEWSTFDAAAARADLQRTDLVVASDCVYGNESSLPLANVLVGVLKAGSAGARLLFCYERRLPHPARDVSYADEFFNVMLTFCRVERLSGTLEADDISLWLMQLL